MKEHPLKKMEWSALATVIGVLILFGITIVAVLIVPNYVDPSWVNPSSPYQKQMYEISDPNLYISSTGTHSSDLQFVYHIQDKFTLLAFEESDSIRFVAPKELEKYITRPGETLKLTSDFLLLRQPEEGNEEFNGKAEAEKLIQSARTTVAKEQPDEVPQFNPAFIVFELYRPQAKEGFALASSEALLENWAEEDHFILLDEAPRQPYHQDPGVIYVSNPIEYRIKKYKYGKEEGWKYDPKGIAIKDIQELKNLELKFKSRKELIYEGEHIYAIEGCWYCHSDQTRTLVQDVVLNGNEDYPAPPSTANEYIYQEITFPATRRIGPDLSRVGVKRPNRDWHKSHFWSPKTESKGSIMPAFQHFFDSDPRGTGYNELGIPNYKFEAIYQYLMTKGTRITAPTQAWWLGKDPVRTKEIIEGERILR